MVEVPESKSGKAYICHSQDTIKSNLICDEEQQRHLTLLFVILSYLFMRGSDTVNHAKTSEGIVVKEINNFNIKL